MEITHKIVSFKKKKGNIIFAFFFSFLNLTSRSTLAIPIRHEHQPERRVPHQGQVPVAVDVDGIEGSVNR